jgi:hypothetical protein
VLILVDELCCTATAGAGLKSSRQMPRISSSGYRVMVEGEYTNAILSSDDDDVLTEVLPSNEAVDVLSRWGK